MGYACPVCGDPQADDEHLANHLAFTAMLGDADHEDWLDDNVPDWDERDPDGLADAVTDLADETDYPQVFEDTTGHDHDHDDERSGALFDDEPDFATAARERVSQDRTPNLDDETEGILDEAREMTEQMLEEGGDSDEGESDGDAAAGDESE